MPLSDRCGRDAGRAHRQEAGGALSESADADIEVVLYSSRTKWAWTALGPLAMIGLSIPAMLEGLVPAFVIAGVFAVLFGVVLATQPLWSRVDKDGVTRRCPLRTQHVEWSEIDAFDRLRRGEGLLIRLANGRHMVVCDRMEGHAENAALQAVVERYQSAVALPHGPELDQNPTDLYRRGGGRLGGGPL